MKKFIPILLILALITGQVIAQHNKAAINHPKKDIAVKKPAVTTVDGSIAAPFKKLNRLVKAASSTEAIVGVTRYDLPTNQSTQNRLYLHSDGTIGATWNFGVADPNFADRGTGYNYFDGSSWLTVPTSRIESIRTGWPSYVPYGASGEAVLAHDFALGNMILSRRQLKGSGNWTQSIFDAPASCPIAWPRMVSNGTSYNQFHMICVTKSIANGGSIFQGLDGAVVYSRSLDGGDTWDIQNTILPGTTSAEYKGFGGDTYTWAEPKDNTLAFVVGDNWNDVFMMKSTDNGNTWTITIIFQHPYPMFDETHTIVADTPYVCDGSIAIALDNNHKAHVFFGIMRVLNDDTTDAATSYFPYTDGLAYWNEDMPTNTSLDYDTLANNNQLVGYMQDINGNDSLDIIDIATYYLSMTSMPSVCIDENNKIHLVYSSIMENLDNGVQNYRHIYANASFDLGNTWLSPLDLTGSIIHNFDECVFPSMSPTSDDQYFYFLYQADEEPGLSIRGDEDPPTDNSIILVKAEKWTNSIGDYSAMIVSASPVFPNPAQGAASINLKLAKNSEVELSLVNNLGQQFARTLKQKLNAGEHLLNIDLGGLAPGAYICTIKAGNEKLNRKLIVQ